MWELSWRGTVRKSVSEKPSSSHGIAEARYPLGTAATEIRASLVPASACFSADTPCCPESRRGYADLRDDHLPVTLCESAPVLGV